MTKYLTPEELLQLIKKYNSETGTNNDDKGQHVMYDEVIQIQDQNSYAGYTFSVENYYKDGAWYKQVDIESDQKIIDKIKSYSWTASGCNIYLLDEDYHEVKNRVFIGKVKYSPRRGKS